MSPSAGHSARIPITCGRGTHYQSPKRPAHGHRRHRCGVRAQDTGAEADGVGLWQRFKSGAFGLRIRPLVRSGLPICPCLLGPDFSRTYSRLVTKHQVAILRPVIQSLESLVNAATSGTKVPPHCSAASTAWACSGPDGSGRIRQRSVWVGMMRAAPIWSLFDDEIRTRLLYRSEDQPQIRRNLKGARLGHAPHTSLLGGLDHLGLPLPVCAIEQRDVVPPQGA